MFFFYFFNLKKTEKLSLIHYAKALSENKILNEKLFSTYKFEPSSIALNEPPQIQKHTLYNQKFIDFIIDQGSNCR